MHRSPEQLRAELEDRLRFEMLLTELSARFVSVSSASIDEEIINALGQIVEALDLDRSVLGQLVEDGRGFVHTHCWYRPGLVPLSESAVKDLPWMASMLAQGTGGLHLAYRRSARRSSEGKRSWPPLRSSLKRNVSP